MRSVLALLAGVMIVVGCGQKSEDEKEIDPKTGKLLTEYEYYLHPETNQKIKHGYYRTYHVVGKGEYRETGTYEQGVKIGVWTYYHENGKKRLELNLKGPNEHGIVVYYKNGNKNYGGTVKEGQREGSWTFYHESP